MTSEKSYLWEVTMKKNTLLTAVFWIMLFTSACGGLVKFDRISSVDFFSGIKWDAPLENMYSSAPYSYYHTTCSMEDIKQKLGEISKDMGSFSVEKLTGHSLLVRFSESEKNALFLVKEFSIQNWQHDLPYHYWVSDFSASLYTSDKTKEVCGIAIMDGIPLPHHLLGEEIHGSSFSEDQEIPITGSIDAFEAFYQTFQKAYPDHPMKVECSENQLTIRNVPVKHDYKFYDGTMHYQTEIIEQIIITFSENSDQQPVITLACKVN
jgi:hypothetical protein